MSIKLFLFRLSHDGFFPQMALVFYSIERFGWPEWGGNCIEFFCWFINTFVSLYEEMERKFTSEPLFSKICWLLGTIGQAWDWLPAVSPIRNELPLAFGLSARVSQDVSPPVIVGWCPVLTFSPESLQVSTRWKIESPGDFGPFLRIWNGFQTRWKICSHRSLQKLPKTTIFQVEMAGYWV